jgi:hypothetical protein
MGTAVVSKECLALRLESKLLGLGLRSIPESQLLELDLLKILQQIGELQEDLAPPTKLFYR